MNEQLNSVNQKSTPHSNNEPARININVNRAVQSSKGLGYSKAKWKQIQAAVGTEVDGFVGPKTVTKVAEYQAKHGLEIDGISGPITYGHILSSEAKGATPKQEPKKTEQSTGTDINIDRAVQANKSLGYSRDKWRKIQTAVGTEADGYVGPNTVRKIVEYQAKNGLEVDGISGPRTYDHIVAATAQEASQGQESQKTESNVPKQEVPPAAASEYPEIAAYSGTDTLKYKSKNKKAVKCMQAILKRAGFPITVDGDFGPGTMLQLLYFQYTRNLQSGGGICVDGECGPLTWAALRNDPGAVYSQGDGQAFVSGKPTGVSLASVGGGYEMEEKAAAQYNNMTEAYKAAYGSRMTINSAFRAMTKRGSQSGQIELYRGYICGMSGYNLAAKPGYSNHQSGRSIDVNSGYYDWLIKKCSSYNFKNDVAKEPWHWTYYP